MNGGRSANLKLSWPGAAVGVTTLPATPAMHSRLARRTVFSPIVPPLWYVSDGELTVGPVSTSLLLKGVEHGKVHEDCWVRTSSSYWRNVLAVREVAVLAGNLGPRLPSGEQLVEWAGSAQRVRDEEEFSHNLAWLALVATGAECAMVHYRGPRSRRLFTRAIVGPMATEQFGRPLPDLDPVLCAARIGQPVIGPPFGLVEDALALRMASSQSGVGAAAAIPIFWLGSLRVVLELSRPGHAFRREDLKSAETIAQHTLAQHCNQAPSRKRSVIAQPTYIPS